MEGFWVKIVGGGVEIFREKRRVEVGLGWNGGIRFGGRRKMSE